LGSIVKQKVQKDIVFNEESSIDLYLKEATAESQEQVKAD
jgi:hypothetical protein